MSVFYMSPYRALAIFSESEIIIMHPLSFVVFLIKLSAFFFFLNALKHLFTFITVFQLCHPSRASSLFLLFQEGTGSFKFLSLNLAWKLSFPSWLTRSIFWDTLSDRLPNASTLFCRYSDMLAGPIAVLLGNAVVPAVCRWRMSLILDSLKWLPCYPGDLTFCLLTMV